MVEPLVDLEVPFSPCCVRRAPVVQHSSWAFPILVHPPIKPATQLVYAHAQFRQAVFTESGMVRLMLRVTAIVVLTQRDYYIFPTRTQRLSQTHSRRYCVAIACRQSCQNRPSSGPIESGSPVGDLWWANSTRYSTGISRQIREGGINRYTQNVRSIRTSSGRRQGLSAQRLVPQCHRAEVDLALSFAMVSLWDYSCV